MQLGSVECFYHYLIESFLRPPKERRSSTVLQVRGQTDEMEGVLCVGYNVTRGKGVQQQELVTTQLLPPVVQKLFAEARPQSHLGSQPSRVLQPRPNQLHHLAQSGHPSSLRTRRQRKASPPARIVQMSPMEDRFQQEPV